MPTSSAGCTCSRMSVPIALMPPPPCEPVHMRCAQCVALVLLFCLLGLVLIATIMLVAARLAGVPKVAMTSTGRRTSAAAASSGFSREFLQRLRIFASGPARVAVDIAADLKRRVSAINTRPLLCTTAVCYGTHSGHRRDRNASLTGWRIRLYSQSALIRQ